MILLNLFDLYFLDSDKSKEIKKDEKITVAKIELSEYLSLPITERFIFLI